MRKSFTFAIMHCKQYDNNENIMDENGWWLIYYHTDFDHFRSIDMSYVIMTITLMLATVENPNYEEYNGYNCMQIER